MAFAAFSVMHPIVAAAADVGERAGRTSHPEWSDDARDRVWLARIRAGDMTAFDALAHAYAVQLARFAESITGGADWGDDAVQEVLIELWQRRTQIDVHGSVGAYLYRAVRNRALNVVRRERSQARIAAEAASVRPDRIENTAPALLSADDLRSQVMAVLSTVPARSREIFLLVWANELSYAEVADVLGVGIRTVQNQYYRAVRALSDHFWAGEAAK